MRRLRLGPLPAQGVLAHGDGDLIQAADRGASEDVERADPRGRHDQAGIALLRRGE